MFYSAPNNLLLRLAYWNCSHLLESFIRHLTRSPFDLGLAALGTPSPMKLSAHPLSAFQPQRSQNRHPWQGAQLLLPSFPRKPCFFIVKFKEHFYFFFFKEHCIYLFPCSWSYITIFPLEKPKSPKAVQLLQQEMVSRINTQNYLEHSVRHVCYGNRQNKSALPLHSLPVCGGGNSWSPLSYPCPLKCS